MPVHAPNCSGGTDPMEERKAEKKAALEFRCIAHAEASGEVVDPFREVAARWFEKWRVGKVERYARDTEMRLREDVLSRIGDRPIAVIKPPEIAGLIPEIENRGAADVARRALQNTNQIFRYAVALGERRKNDVGIFPGERDNLYMNRNSMLCALKRMGYKGTMTGHGFRGLATTLLRERGYDKDLVEMQLSHALANKVEEAYNKARYLPQRRVMMQDWSDFLDEIRKSGKVDPLPGRRVKEAADNNERVAVLNLELGLERGVVSAPTGAPGAPAFRNGAS